METKLAGFSSVEKVGRSSSKPADWLANRSELRKEAGPTRMAGVEVGRDVGVGRGVLVAAGVQVGSMITRGVEVGGMADGELTWVGEAVGGGEQAAKINPMEKKSMRNRFIDNLLAVGLKNTTKVTKDTTEVLIKENHEGHQGHDGSFNKRKPQRSPRTRR